MRWNEILVLLAMFVWCLLAAGCAASASGPYKPQEQAARDTYRAQALTLEAADLIGVDDARAERLLCEALTADLFYGPAHNNLGVLYLMQGRLYEAASEFEWARKLMPGHPDPRMNLALTLESAGRTHEALAAYETALEVHPVHMPTMQAMARLQVRYSRTDDRTPDFLREIALRGETEHWREWARRQMVMAGIP